MAEEKHQGPHEQKGDDKKMKMLTIYLPTAIIDIYDVMSSDGLIPNRSEGFRMAIWEYLYKLLSARASIRDISAEPSMLKKGTSNQKPSKPEPINSIP